MNLSEDQLKQIDALCRAMPITRMVDYGMSREAAALTHRIVREGRAWDIVLEELARQQEATAHDEQESAAARELWHAAAASLIFAQMAFNADGERKRYLYQQMTRCFTRFAALSEFPVSRIEMPYRRGRLFGWHFHTNAAAVAGSVIIFGGMSGWSTAYRSMAEAVCRRGLDCLLVDGPGQGDSRLEGGIRADADLTSGFSRFVDWIQERTPGRRIGLWGNSYGGLLAALTATRDRRIAACCINGGPMLTQLPPFRTAQEQFAAMFGESDPVALTAILSALAFDSQHAPLDCPTLVLEGGADPLVPPGAQRGFLVGNSHPLSRVETWLDGEHTIYNHSAERNALTTAWFAEALATSAR
ncbi:alpha/beta fold hydrolase [Bradyrhizobium sp. 170]|uniref:alpha/beta hydrolase n=1 Tax=Bradyrhizobium sp. 170 TaxID=2782641 RepID=UPI0020002F34|nr:alpha/beta fold hydrolase [Bradyrhizobium sp. 170]UPK01338.1 alpha/beta fold hydrolase [Bradyrhizobium sp. 170]